MKPYFERVERILNIRPAPRDVWGRNAELTHEGVMKLGVSGGALLRNIDKLLTQVTGVPCHVAENALNCVALGTGEALKHYDFFKKSLVQSI